MNFKDRWATDETGNKFVFTIEMQRQLSEAGLPIEPESLADLTSSSPRQEKSSQRDKPKPKGKKPADPPKSTFEEPAEIMIDPETGKYRGRVKWYNDSKGYGFIARGGGEQIFFHKSNVDCDLSELTDGAWVLYDVEETQKGFEALDVEIGSP